MSDDELEWVENRYEGEMMLFKSPNGTIDTVTIRGISIHNSLNPINWGYFNTNNNEYIASADVRYTLNGKEGGLLHIEKNSKNEPISFSSILIKGWLYDVPLKLSVLMLDSTMISDIMFFDNGNSESINDNDSNYVLSYSWSKKYGLVQYTYKNGDNYSRIKIN